jgi:hypothetical protein
MGHKALVIGAQTGDLSGVHNDAHTMSTILADRGFKVEVRREKDATQAGIREGLERLVANARADDAVVFYYSGHGNVAHVLSREGIELPERRFIVPTDYNQSSPGDFRGITAIELSVWVARLTERTHNVTVIMDCCHAARMVRDLDLRVKAWPYPTYLDIAEHTGMLKALGLPTHILHPLENPYAVRLNACRPEQSAYEYTVGGVRAGIFTDSLRVALEEAGSARVTWSVLVQRIRNRVMTLEVGQRPEVEGPWARLLFDREQASTGFALPVVASETRNNRVILSGAALLGVSPGDTFGLTPAGARAANDETILGRATVVTTDGVTVEADVDLYEGCAHLPSLAEAHPLTTSAAGDPVRVRGDDGLAAAVRSAIDAVPTLRTVGVDHEGPVLAEVTVAGALTLHDGGAAPLATESADDVGVGRVVASLRRMARTAVLRRLTPGPDAALTDTFVVEWGRVVDRKADVLPSSGALLHVGERIYVRLKNTSSRSLYFFVFDLGVAHRVTLISVEAGGLLIRRGQEITIGDRIDGAFVGSPLVWPEGLAVDGPRPETLLVLVTDEPHDLSGLVHDGVMPATRGRSSPLARELAAALGTVSRDWGQPPKNAGGFAVVHLDFDLSRDPPQRPESAKFHVDERPPPSARALRPRKVTRSAAGRTVAVRVTDLVVHRNRALGGTDVRVDTLVLTGGVGANVPDLAKTAWFSRVRDGDRLSMDNLLMYHGPAVDYLDIAWWVSRDDRHGRALSELLRDRLTDDGFQTAVQSLTVVAPQVGLALTALSAGAIIVNTAYELLSQAVHRTIGLYRTSFLASEGFGAGRHPVNGSFTVQDFSFAYEILDAG